MTHPKPEMPEEIWARSTDPNTVTNYFGDWESDKDCFPARTKLTKYTRTPPQPSADDALLKAIKMAKLELEVTGMTGAHAILAHAIEKHEARKP